MAIQFAPLLWTAAKASAPLVAQGLATAGIGTAAAGLVTGGVNAGKNALHGASGEPLTRAQLLAKEEGIGADGRLTDWGFDNQWGAFWGGPKRSEVREAKIGQEGERMTKGQQPSVNRINESLPEGLTYTPDSYTFGEDDPEVYKQGIKIAEQKAGKLSQLAESNGGSLPAGFDMNSSFASINSKITSLAEDKSNSKSMDIGGAKWAAIEQLKQQRIQNARTDHQFAEQARQLNADRELQRAQQNDNMQIQMLNYQGQREDRAYRRDADRRAQQQQSIAMLIKGLSQMGAGFAI